MTLDSQVLARILLLQNMLTQFDDREELLAFVCRGLEEIPGVEEASFSATVDDPAESSAVCCFPLRYNQNNYGEICLTLSAYDAFKPYHAYITNFCFMIAVVLEERRQNKLNKEYRENLEKRVAERTRELQNEISERKRAQVRAKRAQRKAEHYLDVSEAMILELDREGKIKIINKRGCEILGYKAEELIGEDWFKRCLPADVVPQVKDVFYQAVDGGEFAEYYENEVVDSAGKLHWFAWHNELERDETGQIVGVLCSGNDITELKRNAEERVKFEKQMLQAQKLESLGVLAGGIAHDFNNLLASIMGHAELTRRRLPPESGAIGNLKQIELATERAADLAKQMLAYSGKGKFVVETINLNPLLEEMLHMLKVSISKKAVLRLDIYESLPQIDADATQIRQIVMNLVINASEAIGDKSGVISISTGCMDCDQKYLEGIWLDDNSVEGLYVYLEVADTGCGMDKETLAKLFDPFFSTKFTGRGLGMSAVMGIVRGHKGAIRVYSEPGKGTTFKILLPASEKPEDVFNGHGLEEDWSGTGKVLLVDDEETVRGIGVEMLKELGFDPLTAKDGWEALEVFKDNSDIGLVILDLTMPKMDGQQCFRELKALAPGLKIILSSGYNEYEVSQKFIGKGLSGFIQKPYKLSILREALKLAIAEPTQGKDA